MEESLALISNKLSLANIEVVKLFNPLPEIQADPAHMKQVFLNLLINASEAMEEGGTLTIRSDHHPDTNTVTMSVRDTGVGIDPKDLARIFDPFFSTKKKGTGLGLSVVNASWPAITARWKSTAPREGNRFPGDSARRVREAENIGNVIYIRPVGAVDHGILQWLRKEMGDCLMATVQTMPLLPVPPKATRPVGTSTIRRRSSRRCSGRSRRTRSSSSG